MSLLSTVPGHVFTEHILTFVESSTLLRLAATSRTLRARSESDVLWAALYKVQGNGKANCYCLEGQLEIFPYAVVDGATLDALTKNEIRRLCNAQVPAGHNYNVEDDDDGLNLLRVLKECQQMKCALHGKWKASYYWRSRYMSANPAATDEELCGSNFMLFLKLNPRQIHFRVRFHLDGRFDMDLPPELAGMIDQLTSWSRVADGRISVEGRPPHIPTRLPDWSFMFQNEYAIYFQEWEGFDVGRILREIDSGKYFMPNSWAWLDALLDE